MVSKFPVEFGTLFTNTSLGNSKSKYHRQLLITSLFAELNNFVNKGHLLVTNTDKQTTLRVTSIAIDCICVRCGLITVIYRPGILSMMCDSWPGTISSGCWTSVWAVSRTRPEGFPPTLTMNGLPAKSTPTSHSSRTPKIHASAPPSRLRRSVTPRLHNFRSVTAAGH